MMLCDRDKTQDYTLLTKYVPDIKKPDVDQYNEALLKNL